MTGDFFLNLQQHKFPEEACLILFGSNQCSVCSPIKEKIEEAIKDIDDYIQFYYINTNENIELAASLNVFTVPVVIFSFQGDEYHRWVRHFGITEILSVCKRIIQLSK